MALVVCEQRPCSGSIVIPAYNEAGVIERCLEALATVDAFVVVVANGCTDDTATRARKLGVEVIELAQGSKIAALNAGDAACGSTLPRIYLDADVVLTALDASEVMRFLCRKQSAIVCSPRMILDDSRSSFLVRCFYRAYRLLPYLNDGMVGSGCYAVNEAGRARWAAFPPVMGDDLFVQGRFEPADRVTIAGASFVVSVPRSMRALLRVRTRAYRGNRQAVQSGQAGSMADSRRNSLNAIVGVAARNPARIGDLFVYYAANVVAALRAQCRGANREWLRDTTTRV